MLEAMAHLFQAMVKMFTAAHIQEGLVNGKGLHKRGELREDIMDFPGHLLIAVHASGDEDPLGTQNGCSRDGHGTMDPEFAGFIGSGGNDPPGRILTTANNQRLSGIFRVV